MCAHVRAVGLRVKVGLSPRHLVREPVEGDGLRLRCATCPSDCAPYLEVHGTYSPVHYNCTYNPLKSPLSALIWG